MLSKFIAAGLLMFSFMLSGCSPEYMAAQRSMQDNEHAQQRNPCANESRP